MAPKIKSMQHILHKQNVQESKKLETKTMYASKLVQQNFNWRKIR